MQSPSIIYQQIYTQKKEVHGLTPRTSFYLFTSDYSAVTADSSEIANS